MRRYQGATYKHPPSYQENTILSSIWVTYLPMFPNTDPQSGRGGVRSQVYWACVARRGVASLKPDDPKLGLIGLIMIGMADVSSVDFDDLANFEKKQEVCRFCFGRSMYCLVLGTRVKFNPDPIAFRRHP